MENEPIIIKPRYLYWKCEIAGCPARIVFEVNYGNRRHDRCVFSSLKSYRSTEGAFSTSLTRLSRNLLIDHYRRTRQERLTDPIEDQLPILEQKEHGGMASVRPDRALAGREASEILQAALAKLS